MATNNTTNNTTNGNGNVNNSSKNNNVTVNAKTKVVTRKMSVRKDENSPEHPITVSIDMSNLPIEQTLEWASRALNVTLQNKLRTLTESFLKTLEKKGLTVDATSPTNIVDPDAEREKQRLAVEKYINSLDADGIEAMMAALAAKKSGK